MRGKTAALTLTLALALALPLTACSFGGLTEKDAMCYIQGTMDENYLGKADPEFLELIDISEEDVDQIYADSLTTEAQFFLTLLWRASCPRRRKSACWRS